jgi:drug/metabolite transporter (DMT)-like permease
MIDFKLQRNASLALLAAALFGASAPFSNLLLAGLGPFSLAALLYLGSGLGLFVYSRIRHMQSPGLKTEAPLVGRDYLWLAAAIACGGVAAPVLLLWGLSGIGATEASLLLSTEGVLTVMISAVIFREHVDHRIWMGAALMLLAGAMLSYAPSSNSGISLHALAVVGACALWGVDNNLTRPISGADPVAIAMLKGLAAGATNLLLAFGVGEAMPSFGFSVSAMALGSLAYGASLLLYILALRHLGSARAAAHFGAAPFIGAALSTLILGEPWTLSLTMACGLMVLATWLALSERHSHEHQHEPMAHAHLHVHDAHHQHAHAPEDGPEPHAHPHRHTPLLHAHPHLPDLHHRHGHD